MTSIQESGLDLEGLDDFLGCKNHALVLGGPGSGKTTAALVKAKREVSSAEWKPYQTVLFLSFARSTIARVAEAAGSLIDKSVRKSVELTTYHSFVWSLIRSHGYLMQHHPPIKLLPPHDSAVRLSDATKDVERKQQQLARESEKRRLLKEEGLLDFDLFAGLAAELLENSERISGIVSCRYPLIILDEFQDTNADEYRFITCLAKHSQVIALADPEQRIYEFRGADPKRIEQFIDDSSPEQFDLEQRNHRSNGRDILKFANDLLARRNSEIEYDDVDIRTFPPRKGSVQHLWVKAGVLSAIKRLVKTQDKWAVAVLVPTKNLMLTVSDYLSSEQEENGKRLPSISHDVAVDAEGPTLAGITIGRLMECSEDSKDVSIGGLIEDLCSHMSGRRGNRGPSKADRALIDAFRDYLSGGSIRGAKRKRVVDDCERIVAGVVACPFVGDPFADWIRTRDIISASSESVLQCLAADARHLRFLHKGASLRTTLSSLWRTQQCYLGAAQAVQNAFVQEHFVATSREPRGVHVMTIHKSKGKQFDEVLVYEGTYSDRIVRNPVDDKAVAQARLTLRVAASRAKRRVTILTPSQKPCELL